MTHPAANLLADATSPYLLQHAANPVHWRPWGPEALAEAQATGKPILLSVGYAACHWCHVMAHESFEDPDVAAVMNALFVNIKVDREERPDIDQIYMAALHAFGEQGGWPMTLFLDSTGGPFWGGTYFPKEPKWGRPGFVQVLHEMARIHAEEPQKVAKNAAAIRRRLEQQAGAGPGVLGRDFLDAAAERLLELVDPRHGGTRGAPKFPQTNLLELFWRAGRRGPSEDGVAATLLTLERMSRGGIWDHLGGGFARYSTDEVWLVPHFEKMLYDNAQILELLGRAWGTAGLPLFRERIEGIVTWLSDEMTLPGGAFASAIDADSEHEEGRFYVWSAEEIVEVLGPAFDEFAAAYDVRPGGNWEGKTILNRSADDRPWDRAREARLAASRAALLARRAGRIRPATDDKVLADWNGAMIHALALAARRLDRPDWLDRATAAYRFIAESMTRGDRLGHCWRAGRLLYPGLSGDHAHMIRAALTLYETTRAAGYLDDALRWARALERHHADPSGGWFVTADDAEALIVRPRSAKDDAVPNPNAVAVDALVRLAVFTGDATWTARAEAALDGLSGAMLADIYATAGLGAALDTLLGLIEVVLIVPAGTDGEALRRVVFESNDPRVVLFETESTAGLAADHPAAGKPAVQGLPTAWVCRDGACGLPVTEPSPLRTLLETGRPV
ncbi:thioredoxin domain-containing protein [Siculibacillus lacustris]|uniref:Thioredoxin domain-containing protein n=1 Tax=Siculibacillus lacustris TaxID=1549641 RepID=A0A4V2KT56_9HYPH|nr:thioredoxin domain-containing protein [Siculibacillus lacustris]TBW35802.1 thioredoxin domain-containing protein [Siculibacillus lacustris]